MIVLFLYKVLFLLAAPIYLLIFLVRFIIGKEDRSRFMERFGKSTRQHPDGKLIWMHGASVGECLSMLSLIKCLLDKDPGLYIMVTSGTITSAELMKKRLPERAFHQYIPLDIPGLATRFIRHFKPQAVLWFESEFWPVTLASIKKAKIPLILLNGRISDRSFALWKKQRLLIRSILNCFVYTLGQSEEDVRRLQELGSSQSGCVGNIKFAALSGTVNERELEYFRLKIGNRPTWVMASTHGPEEEMILATIDILKRQFPNLLTICAPRHPERAEELKRMFLNHHLKVAQRSIKEDLSSDVDVYLADTLGEMNLIYQLGSVVFVGGSLIRFGGQNMLEPMFWNKVVCVGEHTENFRTFMAMGKERQTVIEVKNPLELADKVAYYLSHPEEQQQMGQRAHEMAISEMAVLDRVYAVLKEQGVVV